MSRWPPLRVWTSERQAALGCLGVAGTGSVAAVSPMDSHVRCVTSDVLRAHHLWPVPTECLFQTSRSSGGQPVAHLLTTSILFSASVVFPFDCFS